MTIRLSSRSHGVLVAFLVFCAMTNTVSANTIHVPNDFPTIQEAIDAANDGDTVLVASGVYHESIDFFNKNLHLLSEAGAQVTVIDGQGFDTSVVRMGSGTIEGFTIENGVGTLVGNQRQGGGLYRTGGAPTVRSCTVRKNNADVGGGAYGVATIIDSIFEDNHASFGGAVMPLGEGLLEDSLFIGNSAEQQGGAVFTSSAINIVKCTFQANSANHGGAAFLGIFWPKQIVDTIFIANVAYQSGGAIYVVTNNAINVDGCTFIANEAPSGGAIYLTVGNWPWHGDGQVMIHDCDFESNSATIGGGIAVVDFDSVTISTSRFSNNHAFIRGGGIYIDRSSASIASCEFQSNTVDSDFGEGGAVYVRDECEPTIDGCDFQGNSAAYGGGMFLFLGAAPDVIDCHFLQNNAHYGGAVANFVETHARFTNSEFYNNVGHIEGGAFWIRLAQADMMGCLLQDNWGHNGGGIYSIASTVTLEQTDFIMNIGNIWGGGIYGRDGSRVYTDGCRFLENRAWSQSGGALYLTLCGDMPDPMILSNSIFDGNRGAANSAAVFAGTCHAHLYNCSFVNSQSMSPSLPAAIVGGTLILDNCRIENNNSDGIGCSSIGSCTIVESLVKNNITGAGPIHFVDSTMHDAMIRPGQNGLAVIDGSTFVNAMVRLETTQVHGVITNSTFESSPIWINSNSGSALIDNCWINGSTVIASAVKVDVINSVIENAGTGISTTRGTVNVAGTIIRNCTFGLRKSSTGVGSTILVNSLLYGNQVGLSQSADGHVYRLYNSTLANNGTAISSSSSGDGQIIVRNSIIADPVVSPDDQVSIFHSNVSPEWTGPGFGNISADPLFVNPESGNYRLLPNSPCIDAGHNWMVPKDLLDLDDDGDIEEFLPIDFDGHPRFVQNTDYATGCGTPAIVDMGAFEFQQGIAAAPVFGDLTGDGNVDGADLTHLLLQWGVCDGCCLADLNLSGIVDGTDLIILLTQWQ